MALNTSFEGATVGSVPSGWSRINDGTSGTAAVDDTRATDGSKSILVDQPNTGSPSHWHLYTSNYSPSGNHSLTWDAYVSGKQNLGSADSFQFINKDAGGNSATKYAWRVDLVGSNGNDVQAFDGDGSGNGSWVALESTTYGTWYTVRVDVDYGNDLYYATIDGTRYGPFGFQHDGAADEFPVFEIDVDNYKGWFDNLSQGSADLSITNPTTLTAGSIDPTSVALAWDDVEGSDGYRVYRAQSPGTAKSDYSQVMALSGGDATCYTDTGLDAGTTYYYRVTAFDGSGESSISPEASESTKNAGWKSASWSDATDWNAGQSAQHVVHDSHGDYRADEVRLGYPRNPVPGKNLVAHYSFSSGSGTAITDHSGNGNDAALNGTFERDVPGLNSTAAVHVSGGGNYAALPWNYDSTRSHDLSIVIWFKYDGTGTNDFERIVSHDGSEYYRMAVDNNNASGSLEWYWKDASGGERIYSTSAVPTNTWVMWTGVIDSGNGEARLYKNDANLQGTYSGSTNAWGTGTNRYGFLWDGSEASSEDGSRNNSYADGTLGLLLFFHDHLSTSEISDLYQATAGSGSFTTEVKSP